MVHVEELAYELVDGVLGFDFDVHRQKKSQEEADSTGQSDQLWRAQLAGPVVAGIPIWNTLLKTNITVEKVTLTRNITFRKVNFRGEQLSGK